MHDVSRLRRQARTAYETGRLRFAVRVAAIVGPLTALCAWETRAVPECAVLGSVLLAVSVALRWWRRQGAVAVTVGLHTGILPMVAALVLCRLAPHWPQQVAAGVCGTAGMLAGLVAGHAMTQPITNRLAHWIAIAVVACVTAALGCVGLGLGTTVGSAVGVALGTSLMTGVRIRA